MLRPAQENKSHLWQCSMSLFSLTSFYELTNKTFINSTSLLLGIPTPHALFLKSQGQQYASIGVWSDFLLNNPAYAGDTRKLMFLSRLADSSCGSCLFQCFLVGFSPTQPPIFLGSSCPYLPSTHRQSCFEQIFALLGQEFAHSVWCVQI